MPTHIHTHSLSCSICLITNQWPAFQLYYTKAFVKTVIKHLLPEILITGLTLCLFDLLSSLGISTLSFGSWVTCCSGHQMKRMADFDLFRCRENPRFSMNPCHKKHQCYLLITCVWIWRAMHVVILHGGETVGPRYRAEMSWTEMLCRILTGSLISQRRCYFKVWKHASIWLFDSLKVTEQYPSITLVLFYDDSFR